MLSRVELLLSRCYDLQGEQGKRIAALQRAAAYPATSAVVGPALAKMLEGQGRLDEAIRVYSQLLAARPESRLDLLRLAIQETRRQHPARRSWKVVEQELADARRSLPGAAQELALLAAELLTAQGRNGDARGLLRAAIAREPGELPYRVALARLSLIPDQGTPPAAHEALELLDQADATSAAPPP